MAMNRDSKVYLSGPITGIPDYKKKFKEKQKELWRQGFGWVVNPAEVNSHMPFGMTHAQYMDMSYAMMSTCDTIILMKGWKASEGCRAEEAYARAHGMEVVYEDMERSW